MHIDLVLLSCLEKMENILFYSMFLLSVLALKNSYILSSAYNFLAYCCGAV